MKVIYDDERGEVYYDNIDQVIMHNLISKKLDFNKVSQLYVKYLENLEYIHTKQITEADYPLMNIIKPVHPGIINKKAGMDAIYRYLVKYERFKGAPVWDELVEYVKDNKINIEGSYFCDLYNEVKND